MSMHDNGGQLKRSMKSRHLFMLSLGGVIGTGLFMGAGYTINSAGPGGAVVAYLISGLLMYMVMACLGELSVVMPVSGSFQAHATRFVGPATGFMTGWLYWMSWVTTVGLEFTAAGVLMQRWFPDTSVWIWSALFVVLLFSLNALTTRGFAESEYWFAGIKVFAVIAFILIGGAAVFGLVGLKDQPAPLLSNFSDFGLFPTGIASVLVVMMTVVYAFQGSEIMGVAAGETEEPQRNIPKAIRNIVFRVLIFYVLAIIVVSALVPYQEATLLESPFVAVFDMVGIPFAADIMNFIVLTAILSVGNSGLYASTRLLWALAKDKMAPSVFTKLTTRGVPLYALIVTLGFSLVSLLTSVVAAETVFVVLLSVSGLAGTVTWLVIALTQYNFRKKYLSEGKQVKDLKFAVPFFPYLPILCILICISIFVFTAIDATQRTSLYYGFGFIAACYLFYYFKFGRKKEHASLLAQESAEQLVP